MVSLATGIAIVLYLLPICILVVARAGKDTALGDIGLSIPVGVCLDLLATLLMARVFRLAIATLVTRGIWTVAGCAYLGWRRRRNRPIRWPAALGSAQCFGVALAAAAAVYLSLEMSRPYAFWDREWHIPLVSLLRAERVPFHNVYEPARLVHYHFAGDVLAAMVQSLSFGIMHSSRALSIAHDLLYGLTGATVALLVQELVRPRVVPTVLSALAVLMAGPATFRRGHGDSFEGYSDFNNLTLSFRPHVAVAGLLCVAVAGVVLVRAAGRSWSARTVVPTLFAVVAVLAITDEISSAILGISLAVVWLVRPGVLHPKRWTGLVILGGLALTILVSNQLFEAALVRGGPVNTIKLVAPRSPGYLNRPALPLTSSEGLIWFMLDVLPILLIGLALAWHLLTRPGRDLGTHLAFVGALGLLSLFAFGCVDVNGRTWEGHRYLTAARHVFPLFGLIWMRRAGRGTLVSTLLLAAILSGAASTFGYIRVRVPALGSFSHAEWYEMDCRKEMDGRVNRTAEPTYISQTLWFSYAGCRPVFAPGLQRDGELEPGVSKVGGPAFRKQALRELDSQMVARDRPLRAICPTLVQEDAICEHAVTAACSPLGSNALSCWLSPEDRTLLVR